MSKYDIWCELCEDRIKAASVKIYGKHYEVCKSCASMTVQSEKNQ